MMNEKEERKENIFKIAEEDLEEIIRIHEKKMNLFELKKMIKINHDLFQKDMSIDEEKKKKEKMLYENIELSMKKEIEKLDAKIEELKINVDEALEIFDKSQ